MKLSRMHVDNFTFPPFTVILKANETLKYEMIKMAKR